MQSNKQCLDYFGTFYLGHQTHCNVVNNNKETVKTAKSISGGRIPKSWPFWLPFLPANHRIYHPFLKENHYTSFYFIFLNFFSHFGFIYVSWNRLWIKLGKRLIHINRFLDCWIGCRFLILCD